jgi:tRNA dimethylallyltransferase
MVAYLRGEMTLEDAIAQMKRLTRRFVRHQGAWFREQDQQIYWFEAGSTTFDEVLALIQREESWLPQGTLIEG